MNKRRLNHTHTSSAGLDNFTADYISGNFVTVTAVPEPSTLLLAAVGVVTAVAAVATEIVSLGFDSGAVGALATSILERAALCATSVTK